MKFLPKVGQLVGSSRKKIRGIGRVLLFQKITWGSMGRFSILRRSMDHRHTVSSRETPPIGLNLFVGAPGWLASSRRKFDRNCFLGPKRRAESARPFSIFVGPIFANSSQKSGHGATEEVFFCRAESPFIETSYHTVNLETRDRLE